MINSILITGGGSGIGAALACAMADRETNVLISGRRTDALETAAATSKNISICPGDITDQTHRIELANRLASMPGPRAIFHGAGYFQTGLLDTLTADDWQQSFNTNVTARWELSRACGPHLDGGRLLFIGSDAGANPRAGAAAYSVAQSASETLRRALQAEWADRNIAITGFKPGLVDTDMVRGFMAKSLEDFPSRADYEKYVSSGQVTGPDTIAAFASWLLLDVAADRYTSTEWDVRTPEHHAEWLIGPLYGIHT